MNYTILIVDDDMAINDMLVKYLRKNGYITYSAYSGTEALLFLEKQKVNLIHFGFNASRSFLVNKFSRNKENKKMYL